MAGSTSLAPKPPIIAPTSAARTDTKRSGTGNIYMVLSCGLWAANRWISPELGGVIGPAALAAWLHITGGGVQRGKKARLPSLAALGRAVTPYAVLILLLIGSRYWEAARSWLTGNLLLRFPDGAFALPLLYNPGASLAVACGVTWLLFRGGKLNGTAALTTTAWVATAWTREAFDFYRRNLRKPQKANF